MTTGRLLAIALIYGLAGTAWCALGVSVTGRLGEFDSRLSEQVALLWGGTHAQAAPTVWFERPKTVTETLKGTDASGRSLTQEVFTATYRTRHSDTAPRTVVAQLRFPSAQAHYDNFAFRLNGREAARAEDLSSGATAQVDVAPGADVFFDGYTGLTVTVGAILTLFVLMQLTARVDWGFVFAREPLRAER
jgi:hypothetical protein